MSNKSIDGLRRRSSVAGPRNKSSGQIRPTTSIGLVPKINNRQQRTSVEETKPVAVTPEVDDGKNKSIREFLDSVKDSDPATLVELGPENKKGKKKHKKRRKKRTVLIIIGIILLLIIGAGVWLYIQGNDFVARVTNGGSLWGMATANPDIPLESDPTSGRTNVLVFGTEGYDMDNPNYSGGWLTDSMMVASIDQETGDTRTISLPRDLKSKTCTSTSKLNEAYYCVYRSNDGTEAGRAEKEMQAAMTLADRVEEILGIEIQYFVHVNWQAVVQIVDTVGGIDMAFVYKGEKWSGSEVAIETTDKRGLADYYDAKCKCYGIKFDNGTVAHLNGEQALGVIRARNAFNGYGAGGGNFSREQFQQKVLQALALKVKDTNFVADFMAALRIKDAVGDNLRMSFKDTELKTLFGMLGRVKLDALQSVSLQTTDDGTSLLTSGMLPAGSGGLMLSYVYPKAGVGNYTDVHAYVKRKLSSDPMISEGATVAVLNATSVASLAATEGKVLSGKGYNVVKTTNAPADFSEQEGMVVYQLGKGVSGTAKALRELYGVKVITKDIPASLTSMPYDFIVIIGSGYAAIE